MWGKFVGVMRQLNHPEQEVIPGLVDKPKACTLKRRKKMYDAMERMTKAAAGDPWDQRYWIAKADFDVALVEIRWTRFRWQARQRERKARTPLGHDQRDWV